MEIHVVKETGKRKGSERKLFLFSDNDGVLKCIKT